MAKPSCQERDPGQRRPAAALFRMLALCLGMLAATPAGAESQRPVVDLELILAVDISSSMTEAEQRVQRNGYVSAFRHRDVVHAMALGPYGKIAVIYVEWAGPNYQRVVVPWTMIETNDDARRFADALAAAPIMTEAGTSISSALLRAGDLFTHSRSLALRRVIDISGDGPNNVGPPIAPVRDMLVRAGISINGLPIAIRRDDSNAFAAYRENDLETYFDNCVIGGPDAFIMAIHDLSHFEVAIRRKLIREIAGKAARTWPAAYQQQSKPVFDCLAIGQAPGR